MTAPQVVVGTIHSVKGGQADVVYLFPDSSQAGDAQYQRFGPPRDSVIRLFYVDATRARGTLYICRQARAFAASICLETLALLMVWNEGILRALTGDVVLKHRVQHPKINECKDRTKPYWFFRYWQDELLADRSIKTTRKRRIVGPSKGPNALTKKQAEAERDKFLAELNAAPSRGEAAAVQQPVEAGVVLFGKLAEMWRRDYVENPMFNIAASTRAKYISHLDDHILPRWKDTRISQFRAKDVLDWLSDVCDSWYMMADLRNIMSGIFTKAQEWEILPETFANPMRRVKLPKKWKVRAERIPTEEETVRGAGAARGSPPADL